MLKTNKNDLIMLSAMGEIHHPTSSYKFNHDRNGKSMILPSVGGITYNYTLGDPTHGYATDHAEPDVSIRNPELKENNSLMLLSNIGNEGTVVTGDAKGATGRVIGSHAGVDHTLMHFFKNDLEKLVIGDKILVRGFGLGLKLLDYPDIVMTHLDPNVLENINPIEKDGAIHFPVTTVIPPFLMGAGMGAEHAYGGDYDVMTQDETANEKYGINKLRIGDFVLLQDCDNTYGRAYLEGSVSIGIVIHGDCIMMGHGPGITVFMSSKKPIIKPIITSDANLKNYL